MKIELRQLGQNIILTIEGEQLSKRFADKKERESVKTAVNDYNSLPKSKQTKKGLKTIKEMMDKEAEASTPVAKKTASKSTKKSKTTSKKEAPKKVDEAINFRQLGQNIILKIDGEELSKRFSEKSDREKLKSLVSQYNELPKTKRTKTRLKAIQAMMVKSAAATKTQAKSSKKTEEKKTSTVSKKNISGKQMGQNLILVIEGEKHSKRFPDKAVRTEVLELVQKYNNKNTKTGLEKILNFMAKDTSSTKEKVEKDIDKMSKSEEAPEAASKLTKEEKIAEAKKLLEENGMEVKKKTASSSRTTRRRGGEY